MSKKVIVSGVSGQAGSYFAEYLLKNTDYEIYGMVRRLSVLNHENIEHIKSNPRFHLFSGDLNDSHSIFEAIETIKPDYFINCAAQSFVFESWITPANTFLVDSVAIIHILEAIRKVKPSCRFITFGSSEEMGDVVYSPQDEKHPARARSVYGAAKIASRQIVKVYRESYGLYALQPWNYNYESKRRGVEFVTRKITQGVARIYHAIKNNQSFEPIELGNLDSYRDWSHCEDIVDGVWRMVNQEEYRPIIKPLLEKKVSLNLSEVLNEYILSSNETHSIREFVELSFKYSDIINLLNDKHGQGNLEWWNKDCPDKIKEHYKWAKSTDMGNGFPYFDLVTVNPKFYRPADVCKLHGNSNAARNDLQWVPKFNFNDLVKEMVSSDIKNYKSS